MNPQEINKRIAIACGWTEHEYGDGGMYGWTAPGGEYRPSCFRPYYYEDELPNYHGDLNAMHEAEKILPVRNWTRYCQYLAELGGGSVRFVSVHTTSAQRAEAFLRTIGQWEEEIK